MAARPNTSDAGPGRPPESTSGARYPGVPAAVRPGSPRKAIPKSTRTALPWGVMMTFAGLTSPWTIGGSCPWR